MVALGVALQCRGSLSTGSPAGRPMLEVMLIKRLSVGWLNVQSGPCKPLKKLCAVPWGEHGLRTKATPEKWQAPNPEGGMMERRWVPSPLGDQGPRTAHPPAVRSYPPSTGVERVQMRVGARCGLD